MKKMYLFFLMVFIFSSLLFGVNTSYIKTKVKNRTRLQKKTGAFKHSKYSYTSQSDIKAARYSKNPNLGVVNVNRNEHIRDVNVYVESNSRIDVKNTTRNLKTQIGVVNVGNGARLNSANVVVEAKGGIDIIDRQSGIQNKKTQIGVVNMRKSSQVKNISTKVESKKNIRIHKN